MHSWRLITSLLGIFVSISLLASHPNAETGSAFSDAEDMAIEIGEPASDSGCSDSAEALYQFGLTSEFTQAYSHGNPNNLEQLMLELINASRADPEGAAMYYGIDLNEGLDPGTISSSSKQPLAFNPALIAAARSHSQWMLDTDTFSHTGQDGTNPEDRMEAAGYLFTPSWSWGENLGWSGTTGNLNVEYHARRIVEGLFLSSGHRKNTLSESFEEIGIGGLTGTFEIYNALMVTEKFARSASTLTPMLVGVVYEDLNDNSLYDIGEGLRGITITLEQGSYYAVTSESGGYAVPFPDAEKRLLRVTASGGVLLQPVTKQIDLTGNNVKLDFILSRSESLNHTIILSANPHQGGVVSGGGTYEHGSAVIISASPNPGWIFAGWTEDGLIVSSNSEYGFIAENDCSLTANFRKAFLPGVLILLLDEE